MKFNPKFVLFMSICSVGFSTSSVSPQFLSRESSWDNMSLPPTDEPSAWVIIEDENDMSQPEIENSVNDEHFKVGSKKNISFFYEFIIKNHPLKGKEQRNLFLFIKPFLEVNLLQGISEARSCLSIKIVNAVFQSALANFMISKNYSMEEQRLAQKTYTYMKKSYQTT